MEVALGIIATLLVSVIGWVLYHSAQCSAFHERVAKLENIPDEVSKLREHAHENRNAILRLEAKQCLLESKVDER